MTPPRSPRGTTLTELLVALSVLAILAGIAAPHAQRMADAYAVAAAADALTAGFVRARTAAWSAGGARLVLDVADGRYRVETVAGRRVAGPTDVTAGGRVRIEVDGDPETVEIRYDALGIGRMANRTILLTRGAAQTRLTVSAYGRVRRW